MERYNHLNNYYKKLFGERTLKICVDGNFTCPNRDGTLSCEGCIFCSKGGSGEHLKSKLSIADQVEVFLNSYRATRANKYIVYFQNFTNTYDSIQNLKIKYDSALIDNRIVGLSVATRPDCITEKIAKLLSTYQRKYHVSVELGLQTADDNILKSINTCYSTEDFEHAVSILRKYNIEVISHIMIGLPSESNESISKTVNFLNTLDVQGLKIHSCYVIDNTELAVMYKNGQYTPITLDYYLDKLEFVITHLKPNIVIHRVSGDAPKDLLIAPSWNLHKKWIINGIDKRLREKDLHQGIYYKSE